MHKYDEVI